MRTGNEDRASGRVEHLEPGSPVHAHSRVWAGSTGKDKHRALGEGGTKGGGVDRRWESGLGIGPS